MKSIDQLTKKRNWLASFINKSIIVHTTNHIADYDKDFMCSFWINKHSIAYKCQLKERGVFNFYKDIAFEILKIQINTKRLNKVSLTS